MSELKAYRIKGNTLGVFDDVYIKAEADKLIAELKDKLRHYPMLVALIESDKKELEKKNKEIKMLRRALYKACANWADAIAFEETNGIGYDNSVAERWRNMESKCLAKIKELTHE